MTKIREKEMEKNRDHTKVEKPEATEGSEAGEGEARRPPETDPKVIKVYQAVGRVLRRYKSGKVPKALKILPHLRNWENLLLLAKPATWTPHAMYEATRIFSSNLNERMAQRFFNAVLLPHCRAWMKDNTNLNPHLYQACRKAMYKQKAFMKGFLIPLCEDDCSLREAVTFGSLIQKTSYKVVHAAVGIAKMALMPYSGGTSLFLRVFFDKQYQLPMGCIDAVVQHFGSFMKEETLAHLSELPVLWHQSLLTFAQRYKNDLTDEQVLLIKKVCNKHNHRLITPEIRRELMPQVQRIQKALGKKRDPMSM